MVPMKLWTVEDHDFHYMHAGKTVILAETEDRARALLDAELKANGLRTSEDKPYTLVEVPMDREAVVTFWNGDY